MVFVCNKFVNARWLRLSWGSCWQSSSHTLIAIQSWRIHVQALLSCEPMMWCRWKCKLIVIRLVRAWNGHVKVWYAAAMGQRVYHDSIFVAANVLNAAAIVRCRRWNGTFIELAEEKLKNISVLHLRNYANVVTTMPSAINMQELMYELNYEFQWFIIIHKVIAIFPFLSGHVQLSGFSALRKMTNGSSAGK